MGDRCYVHVQINPLDWHLVASIFDSPPELTTFAALYKADKKANDQPVGSRPSYCWHWDEMELDNKAIHLMVYEANYGWYDEMEEAALTGARFVGSHSYGGEYGPGSYAGYGFTGVHVDTSRDGDIIVPVRGLNEEGTELVISPDYTEAIKLYLDARNKVFASISNLPDSWEEILKLCPTEPKPNG